MSFCRPAVFLDRDGVINRKAPESPDPRYIARLSDFALLPGATDAIADLGRLGYDVFVVTNQRGIARGLVTTEDVAEMHATLLAAVRRTGGDIKAIYVCPHDYADSCDCRKPRAGMLLRAAREHSVDMKRSWMIGDSSKDVEAGRRAGCRTVYLGELQADSGADVVAASLADAVRKIRSIDINKGGFEGGLVSSANTKRVSG